MQQRPSIDEPESPRSLSRARGEIEFRDVRVRFGDSTSLDGVTLRIPAGSTAAIVGHTGSGKSTLVNLIPRIMDATSGEVLVDGHNVREYSPSRLTLGENIALGVKDATEDQILRAAQTAGLATDLDSFPNGLKTMVGERGITLSGGQKQRTAIARAVLRNPRILILDDALSSVDTLTEEKILTALQEVMKGRTTILISHRVSTVRHADRIYVIEFGKLVEEGTHSQLIARGGYYADLYQKQLLEEELEAI
jgi:ATP-binding cassette subfamily B protein